jgi:POT family proton-dependent oligopeptide transporter
MLVLAIGLERFAYYGTRSGMMIHLVTNEGMDTGEARRLYTTVTMLALFTPLLGGLLALGVGPRITAVAGAGLALVGYGLLVVGAPTALCLVVVALGAGIFRPCPWAIAAEELSHETSPSGAAQGDAPMSARRFAAVAAMACVLYGSVNGAAAASSYVMGFLRNTSGPRAVFAFAAFVMVLCLAISGVVFFFGRTTDAKTASAALDPYRAPGAAPLRVARPATGLAFAGLALLLVIELPYSMASALSFYPVEMGQSGAGLSSATIELISLVNPLVVVVATVFAFALLLVATLQRWSTPPLLLYGVGVLVFAVGLVPLALGSSVALLLLGITITAVGEALVAPIAMAYAALAAKGRPAALVVSVWILLSNAGSQISRVMSAERGFRPLLIVLAVILVVAGGATLAVARMVHRTLFDPPEA